LTTATFAPTVSASNHQLVTPGAAALTTTTYAPTVTASTGTTVTPTTASLSLTGYAPTVTATTHITVTPTTAALTITGFAPTVTVPIPGVYSLQVVDVTDPNASPVRIYLGVGGGTMAVKIKT
jgi:hypothetical protein